MCQQQQSDSLCLVPTTQARKEWFVNLNTSHTYCLMVGVSMVSTVNAAFY